ncbi:MAG: YggT family protein [Clostridia bacterium]|nr:YggT family protein [Clostridia bacterium]
MNDFKIIFISALSLFLNLIAWLVMIRCILSLFIRNREDNVLTNSIYKLTEPLLRPVRNLLYKSSLMRNARLDFSPVIVVLIVSVVDEFIKF